jgi:hypothetical protein
MFQDFSRFGLEDWQDLYTEEEINRFFAEFVVVLNHNEKDTYDSMVQITPTSSGLHIGSSAWLLEIGHLKISVMTNASFGPEYRHPKPIQTSLLNKSDCLLLTGFASKADVAPYDQQIQHFSNTLINCLQ